MIFIIRIVYSLVSPNETTRSLDIQVTFNLYERIHVVYILPSTARFFPSLIS